MESHMLFSPLVKSSFTESGNTHIAHLRDELLRKRMDLEEVMKTEVFNQQTGLGEDFQGNSKATLQVIVKKARNLNRSSVLWGAPNPYVLVSVEPENVCPDTTVRRTKTKKDASFPTWDAKFVFAPITSRIGYIKLVVMDESRFSSGSIIGEVRISLTKLLSQNTVEEWYYMRHPGEDRSTSGNILVAAKFQFSMILPLQLAINTIQTEIDQCINNCAQANNENKPVQRSQQDTPSSIPNRPHRENDDNRITTSIESDFLDDNGVLRRKGKNEAAAVVKQVTTQSNTLLWGILDQLSSVLSPTWLLAEDDRTRISSSRRPSPEGAALTTTTRLASGTNPRRTSAPKIAANDSSISNWLLPAYGSVDQERKALSTTPFNPDHLIPMDPSLSPTNRHGTPSAQTA